MVQVDGLKILNRFDNRGSRFGYNIYRGFSKVDGLSIPLSLENTGLNASLAAMHHLNDLSGSLRFIL